MELKLSTIGAALAITVVAGSAAWNDQTKTLTATDDTGTGNPPPQGTGPGGIPTRWWNGDGNGPAHLVQWTFDNSYPYITTIDGARAGYGQQGPSVDFSSTVEGGYLVMTGTGHIPATPTNPNPPDPGNPNPPNTGGPPPTDGATIHMPPQPGVDASGNLIYPMGGQRRTQSQGLGGNRTLALPTMIPTDIPTNEPNRLRFWRFAPVPGNAVCMRNIQVSSNGVVVPGLEFQPPGNWGTEAGFNYTIGNPGHHVEIGAIANFQPGDAVLALVQNPNGEVSDILSDMSDAA